MGKGENKSTEDEVDKKPDSNEEIIPAQAENEEENVKNPPVETAPKTEEKDDEEPKNKKEDVESLRKVIKVDSTEETQDGKKKTVEEPVKKEEDEEPAAKPAEKTEETSKDDEGDDGGDLAGGDESSTKGDVSVSAPTTTRETLEQKRAMLQSIKDFDFQIKKNQEDIGSINQKLDGLSKDLDDLVSLYEIVSEQMNPFVGLSKVTKKRIDALENFTQEIDLLKERTAELESFAVQSGARLKKLGEGETPRAETIDTETILGEEPDEEVPEIPADEETRQPTATTDISETTVDTDISEEISTVEVQQPISVAPMNNNASVDLSDTDLDRILEMALDTLSMETEGKIDIIIDEFIENLKG